MVLCFVTAEDGLKQCGDQSRKIIVNETWGKVLMEGQRMTSLPVEAAGTRCKALDATRPRRHGAQCRVQGIVLALYGHTVFLEA